VPFVGISLDDAEKARTYVAEMKVGWQLWVPHEAAVASAELKVPLVPLTVLVGADAIVERVWSGALSDADAEALLEVLDRQLLTSVLSGSPGTDPGCCRAPAVGTTADRPEVATSRAIAHLPEIAVPKGE